MSRTCACAVAIGLLCAGTAGAVAAEPAGSKPFAGGGILDPSGKVAYVPSTAGGIDALDLATGKAIWSVKEASQPLAATAEKVFAQAPVKGKANQVTIKVIDAVSGKLLQESAAIAFPDWVSVPVTYGRTFRSAARPEQDAVLLVWEARAFYSGGAPPPPEVEAAARKSAQGAVRVALETGRVEEVKKFDVKPEMFPADMGRTKVGDLSFSLEEKPVRDPKNPFRRQRFLKAAGADGKVVWQYEIAAPVFLPPQP